MKLKFRADPKDWLLFGIYAVILLYFVAIAILNLAQFAAGDIDHPFHGFNPFPAFGKDFIGITIVVYIVALVASVLSVSDRFFDLEKGLGFSTASKKEKGYSKWLEERELKRQKDIEEVDIQTEHANAGGMPLINNGKKMWVDNGEGHNLIIGSTGSGKTQIAILPLVKSLAKHDESMIITDPKGEIYEKTSKMLKEKGYNVVLLNFRNPQNGSGWNPLHLPYQYYKNGNSDKANELIDDLAINILYDANAQNQDPFWEKTSADYFSGLCLALFEDAKEEEINLNSVNLFTTVGEEKCGPNATYVNKYFSYKDPASPAYVSASSTLIAPTETKGSILSVFKQKLRLFASRENISEMLSHSDFEMEDIGSKKTAVFIVIQDEKKTYHPLVTIFVKQCYETLVDYAQKCGGKLPYRTNFILDEFANMPPLKDVETMVSAARSRRMRFYFVIQNFAQLSEVYGKNKGDTIKGNCTNIIYLISTELAALEEISKMCGEIKVKTGKGEKEKEETRPLATVSDLQKLKEGEVILLRTRLDPFKTKLEYDWKIKWGPLFVSQEASDAVYPTRNKEVVHVFDLKGYVDKKKDEELNKFINNNMGRNPMARNQMPRPAMRPQENKVPTSKNIDDLVKRIDARLAELEAEEQAERAKMESNKISVEPSVIAHEPVKPRPLSEFIQAKTGMPAIDQTDHEQPKDTVKQENVLATEAVKTSPAVSLDNKKPAAIEQATNEENETSAKTTKPAFNKADFAARITNKVNATMKAESPKTEPEISKAPPKEDYISDDQFFDDFFADDDDDY